MTTGTGQGRACPGCAGENVAAARFCKHCGTPLARNCPACGADTDLEARFCIECGAALEGPGDAQGGGERGEERRTVSILFADLVGYTSLAERLDHESVKALTHPCLTRLATEVERYGGFVDQYIGDNVMAVFGAPVAHENDAERAVRAAWAMQAAMVELNHGVAREFGFDLALRIGINTGEVLTGTLGGQYTVVGDAVNVASRLQGAARVGGILVGKRTRRATADAASYREVGPLSVKGKAEPVEAWELTGIREPSERDRHPGRAAPLVGREAELAQLQALFERVAQEGSPHLVTIVGEAGAGKTRLAQELERRIQGLRKAVHVCRGRCLGFGSGMVYLPLSEMLRAECEIPYSDTAAQVREKLAERLAPLLPAEEGSGRLEHHLAPLARLLGADPAIGVDPTEGEEDQRSARESFFGTVRLLLAGLARERVLLLVWEDIHWADEGTIDLIEYLSRWLRAPVLQVCLAREEILARHPSWGRLRHGVSSIFLEPLTRGETRELIDALARSFGASVDAPERLAERSGGNPLFAEALVERVAEQGGEAPGALPETVQGLLAARLDSLSSAERSVLGHASILGPSFSESALEPLAHESQIDLSGTLDALHEKNLIVLIDEQGQPGRRRFAFKHVLIRDAAYEMLPRALRARKHAEVAELIAQRVGGRTEGVAALLAEHFVRAAGYAADAHLPAAETAKLRHSALECTETAGDAAAGLFANQEALEHYRAAESYVEPATAAAARIAEKRGDVELRLGHIEPAVEAWEGCLDHYAERDEVRRAAQIRRKIAEALAHKGDRDAAIEQVREGIRSLSGGDPSPELVRLYEAAASLQVEAGNNIWAMYASAKALELASALGQPRLASRTHRFYGRVFGRIGEAAKARESLERAVELARGSDAAETVLALLAAGQNFEYCEGDYAGAEARYREALEVAEQIGHVPAQIELRSALAQLAFYRCEWAEVARASDISASLAEREGLVAKLCLPDTLKGQLRWREGKWESSESLFVQAHELAERGGWFEASFGALSGLAVTRRDRGDLEGAESALEDALLLCKRAGFLPQTVQVHAALALTRALAGDRESALEAAHEAIALERQASDPVDAAVALEARGIVAQLPEALEAFRLAGARWERLGRRLDAARCIMLTGRRLREQDARSAAATLTRAADVFDELGVRHLAEQSRELIES